MVHRAAIPGNFEFCFRVGKNVYRWAGDVQPGKA